MANMSIQLEGAKQLEKKLKSLGTKVAKKVVRKAVRKAAKPQQQATKANARSMVGGEMGALIAKNTKIFVMHLMIAIAQSVLVIATARSFTQQMK